MKFRQISFLGLSLIMALPLMAGCGEKAPEPGGQVQTTPPPSATSSPTSAPTTTPAATLSQQTRVVLAEMFTSET
jgi:hypothetical protein